jgi:predicted Fe-S protein YdhL (DUF1289 family)
MDPRTGWCDGCLRTIDEIAAWAALPDGARREVWARIAVRRTELGDRRAEAREAR